MFKERYEKPVVKPAECTDGLLREKYQKPDMELVDLGVVAIVTQSITPTATATSAPTTTSVVTTTASVPTVTATAQPTPTSVLVPSK